MIISERNPPRIASKFRRVWECLQLSPDPRKPHCLAIFNDMTFTNWWKLTADERRCRPYLGETPLEVASHKQSPLHKHPVTIVILPEFSWTHGTWKHLSQKNPTEFPGSNKNLWWAWAIYHTNILFISLDMDLYPTTNFQKPGKIDVGLAKPSPLAAGLDPTWSGRDAHRSTGFTWTRKLANNDTTPSTSWQLRKMIGFPVFCWEPFGRWRKKWRGGRMGLGAINLLPGRKE